jgi:NAD(P)-dependent dehydrogenase (short-subunit alcohol dehydrogenase family)
MNPAEPITPQSLGQGVPGRSRVAGQGVVITGASRGLGAALARELAARGARLGLIARSRGPLEELANEIRAQRGEAHALVGDVADKEQTYALAGTAQALLGEVSVFVSNASALGPEPLRVLADTACEDLERALAVNVVGPFRLGKALLGPMLVRGRGQFVHISSDAAVAAYPQWGAYGASKAAFDHLARIWAAETEGLGVRFFGVDPGEMDTVMHRQAVPDADPSTLARPEAVARRIADWLEDESIAHGSRQEVR